MTIDATGTLTEDQLESLKDLWNAEFPVAMAHAQRSGLHAYLSGLGNVKHWLLCDDMGTIHGWAYSFDRDGGRWFAMLLRRTVQGRGHGPTLLDQLCAGERQLQGWVIDHPNEVKEDDDPYRSPLGFYQKCGFVVDAGSRLELAQVSAVRIFWEGMELVGGT